MLHGALIKFNKTIFLHKWLDNVYSYTRNASPKNKYGLAIYDLLLFTFYISLYLLNEKR